MDGGFVQSPLRLNEGLGSLSDWNEETICARAGKLAGEALDVWTFPKLNASILDAYRPQTSATGKTIDDHPHLSSGAMRNLFDEFRKQVLMLDPCVTEEFLKRYVAYKAETNFVDVVPQPKPFGCPSMLHFRKSMTPKVFAKMCRV